ncbi:hypothetical protein B0H19DRAFT_1149396 [Mycena capillaripes]|nr:hypothetical protein B0H19DRAFT_1149396 [Mycena capillaripes]
MARWMSHNRLAFEYMPKLEYTLAVFLEVLRLFPPVSRLGKIVQTDTTLTAHRFMTGLVGEVKDVTPFTMPVRAGSIVIIDIKALHLNPIYWGPNAADFKLERFVDTESHLFCLSPWIHFLPDGGHHFSVDGTPERDRLKLSHFDIYHPKLGLMGR